MDEVNKWYENTSLETIKSIIKDNVNSASQSFVTIGYYLKNVRTRELYRQDGYKDIWEFAQIEFGLSQSTASRFMSINDKFSVDGNSPILLEEYKNFGSGKLQEMINMSDEQISQITEDTTVAEIKQMKKKDKPLATSHEKLIDDLDLSVRTYNCLKRAGINTVDKLVRQAKEEDLLEIKNISPKCVDEIFQKLKESGYDLNPFIDIEQIEGQTSIQDNFPELLPEQLIPVFEKDGEPYGWTWNQVIAELRQEMQKDDMEPDDLKDGTEKGFQCLGKTYVACQFDNGYITIQNDDCESLFKTSLERFAYEFEWHSNKPKEIVKTENNELSATRLEKTVRPEDSLITTPGCGNGKYDCFSCHRDCDIRQEKCNCVEAPLGNPFSCTTMNVIENLSADIGDKCMFINHDLAFHRAGDHEPVPCCKQCTERCGYACNRAAHEEVKEEIIMDNTDPEEELPKARFTAMEHLKEAIKRENDQLDQMRDSWLKNNPDALLKHETILLALKLHLTDLEYPEPVFKIIHKYQVDPYKEKDIFEMVPHDINTAWSFLDKKDYSSADWYLFQARKSLWEDERYEYERHEPFAPKFHEGDIKQPELPILKNNDQRKEWIDKFESWPVWIDQTETGEKYYRYNLTDKVAIVVKVSKKHAYDHTRYKELKDYEYSAEQYYLLGIKYEYGVKGLTFKDEDSRTFYECNTNKTTIVDYLKVFQRK